MAFDTTNRPARGVPLRTSDAGRPGPATGPMGAHHTEPATGLAPTPSPPTVDYDARPDGGETIALDPGENPSIPPEVDRVIAGRYCLERELGRGGFGVVFLAYDRELHRQVAIKIARRTRERGIDQLLEEGRKVAQLDNPNIVPVFDCGRFDDRTIFIVSKYIDGGSLARQLALRALTLEEALRIAGDVAGALAHAHERGLIHRDLKPSNILLDVQGRAYVADFGLALRTTDRTDMACVEGSPLYMSPEQAGGKSRLVDRRTDVFSFGVILYEMLTGRRPFPGKSAAEFREQVIRDEPPPPRQLRPEIPEALERICLKALAKDPAERHASGWELARDLEGIGARPRRPRPRPRGAAAAVLAAAALLLLAALLLWLLRPRPVPAPAPGPGPAMTTMTLDLQVAEWVLDRGGSVDFVTYPPAVFDRAQLPRVPATLRTIELYKVQPVTRDDVERMAGLTGLKYLHLSDTDITDDCLDVIAGMTNLEMLWVGWNTLGDRGIGRLGTLTKLRLLNLEETQATDAGVAAICSARGLETLDLSGTRISDRAVHFVAALPRLTRLRLNRTRLTDACVDDLLTMRQLRTLELKGTGLSTFAIQRLREGLPYCNVIH